MVERVPRIDDERHVRFTSQADGLLQAYVHVEIAGPDSGVAFDSRRTIVRVRVAVVVETGRDGVGPVGVGLDVRIDGEIPKRPEVESGYETMTLIGRGASPFGSHVVVIHRKA